MPRLGCIANLFLDVLHSPRVSIQITDRIAEEVNNDLANPHPARLLQAMLGALTDNWSLSCVKLTDRTATVRYQFLHPIKCLGTFRGD